MIRQKLTDGEWFVGMGYLRPTDAEICSAHPVYLGRLLHTMQMKHKGPQCRIVWIGQSIDESMHGVPPHRFIVDAGRVDKLGVVVSR